jgi:hypothetical protein
MAEDRDRPLGQLLERKVMKCLTTVRIRTDVLSVITQCCIVRHVEARVMDERAVEVSCAEPRGQVAGIPDS